MPLVFPSRRGRSQAAVTPPPQPALPFRGYWTGMGPRSVSRITANSNARSVSLVEEMTWASAQTSQAMNDAYTLTSAATSRLDTFSNLLDDPATNYVTGKLRLLTGMDSPTWAKALGDGPVQWEDTDGNGTVDIPLWFDTVNFLPAYRKYCIAVANYLATKSTKIKEVTIAGATTIYSEPAIKQIAATANRTMAKTIGYTAAADQAALKYCIDVHHEVFSPIGITSSLSLNPWQEFTNMTAAVPGVRTVLQTTYDMWQYQRTVMGRHGVWQNNSLGAYFVSPGVVEARGGDYRSLYEYMSLWAKTYHQPCGIQTMTIPKMYGQYDPSRPDPTAQYAAEMGFIGVEGAAAGGGFPGWDDNTHITVARAATLNGMFAANVAAVLAA